MRNEENFMKKNKLSEKQLGLLTFVFLVLTFICLIIFSKNIENDFVFLLSFFLGIIFLITGIMFLIRYLIAHIKNLKNKKSQQTINPVSVIDKSNDAENISTGNQSVSTINKNIEIEKAQICITHDEIDSPSINTSQEKEKPVCRELRESYIVIDTETTGFNANSCEIIEVGALKIEDGKVIDSFASLINPHQEISTTIKNITHIEQDELNLAPNKETIIPKFLEFIGNSTIIGHNISFDIRFINKAAKDLNLKQLTNNSIDTLNISRRVLPDLRSHKLQDLINYFGIVPSAKHRALADCDSTYQLLNCLYNIGAFDLNDFVSSNNKKFDLSNINPDNPFKNKKVAFKGTIKGCDNETLQEICTICGFRYNTGFYSYINVLVMGEYTYNKYKNGNLSAYMEDAKEREDSGKLLVISEADFFKQIQL